MNKNLLKSIKEPWAILRIIVGLLFLWPFFDKIFGLGFSTAAGHGWLDGSSPTSGFLLHGTKGPLAPIFQNLAGQIWVDWLFMAGIGGVGLALLIKRRLKLATISGSIILFLIYLATFPPLHNPLLDEHILQIAVLYGVYKAKK